MRILFFATFLSVLQVSSFCVSTSLPLAAESISSSGQITINPRFQQNIQNQLITIDSNDTAYAIWSLDGKIQVARRESTATNFEPAVTIFSNGTAFQPAITASGENVWACFVGPGNAGPGSNLNLYIYKYTPQSGWNYFTQYGDAAGDLITPSIAAITGDNVFIAFMVNNSTNQTIQLISIIEGQNNGVQQLSTNNQNINEIPQITVSNETSTFIDGCVVWSGNTPRAENQAILARCFENRIGSTIVELTGDEEEIVYAQQGSLNFWGQRVVFDNNFRPIVAFHDTDHDGGVFAVKRPANSFSVLPSSGGWVTVDNPVTNFQSFAQDPALARRTTGDVDVVFVDQSNSTLFTIQNATLLNGAANWSNLYTISRVATKHPFMPTIAFDDSNNGTVAFLNENELLVQSLWLAFQREGNVTWSTPLEAISTVPQENMTFLGIQGQRNLAPAIGFELVFALINLSQINESFMIGVFNYNPAGVLYELLKNNPVKPQMGPLLR